MFSRYAYFLDQRRKLTARLGFPITLVALVSALSSPLWAVDCTSSSIGLSSQAEVNNFQSDYGPCDRVLTLFIEGADIVNLDGLSALTSVGSSLHIENNAALTNIGGLAGLVSVGRNLWIQNNIQLTSLNGLSALTGVGETLAVLYNDSLTNLDSLSGVTSLGGSLGIFGNTVLDNVDGLSALTTVGGSENSDQRSVDIRDNDALTNLDGLSALTSVGFLVGGGNANFIVENNAKLTNLNGLLALTEIWGILLIQNNAALTNVDGFPALTRVFGVTIGSNAKLNSVGGLPALTNTGNLSIRDNGALNSIGGLSSLTSVWSSLEIQNNGVLTNLDGLAGITHVGSDLYVQSNDMLDRCESLSRLLDQWDDAEPGPGPGSGGVPDVGDDIFIGNNLAGCNSIEEILANVNLSRINPGLNDAWYDPVTDGQGFFITVFPELGAVALAWFTYETELPPEDVQANLGYAGHRWITALGLIDVNQVHMEIEITSGGIFDTPTDIQRTDPPGSDGTIILTFDSCNSGTVEYDITSINRQGIVPIRRIVNDNIVLCEALNAD